MQFINDVRRGVDYLETRQDIQKSGFAYYGFSWGAASGPHTLALDPRFKVGLFVVGGLQPFKMPPEIDDFNFAPRVKVPVLMLNGDSDSTFPVDMSQKRLFTLLGTPSEHKRHVVYPGGHEVFAVRPSQVAREALDWLDRYLGPVQR